MEEETKVSKKRGPCMHGQSRCKPCKKGYCIHDKQINRCRECGGISYCEHGKRRSRCADCGGGEICEHRIIRGNCIECNGSQICEHKKQRSICIECNGSQICKHKKVKYYCLECEGNGICEHKKQRFNCVECGGSQICEHNVNKQKCGICRGSAYCIHDKIKSNCFDCEGSQICEHKKRKRRCKLCDGVDLCKTPLCESIKHPLYEGHCFYCYVHLFPDKPTVRNYKTKEKSVTDYILDLFPEFDWVHDKSIKNLQGGCHNRRPDLLLDLGDRVIVIEVDENQHNNYDSSCENSRTMQISEDIGHRPLILIRFNPDSYRDKKGEFINSPWKLGKDGLLHLISNEIWEDRLDTLQSHVQCWIDKDFSLLKTLCIVKLYYDE
jgi:hypothetical protein